MRVTEQGAANNVAEQGASGIPAMVHPKPTGANAFDAKGRVYAARVVVRDRSDGPTRTRGQPRSQPCVLPPVTRESKLLELLPARLENTLLEMLPLESHDRVC